MIDYTKTWQIYLPSGDAERVALYHALYSLGFRFHECSSPSGVSSLFGSRPIIYSDERCGGSIGACCNKKNYWVFTIEDVFNGTLMKYVSAPDTTITFADGRKVELSLESYKAMRGE